MSLLKQLFGLGSKVDISELLSKGATIVDVRTSGEFAGGHVKGAINIPLDQIARKADKLRKDRPVVTCCASGMRSGSAASILRNMGYEAHNGGPWTSVRNAMQK